ncbi:MAG: hypothetical protein ACLP9L_22710 [Thermoguttaceae bacterium]
MSKSSPGLAAHSPGGAGLGTASARTPGGTGSSGNRGTCGLPGKAQGMLTREVAGDKGVKLAGRCRCGVVVGAGEMVADPGGNGAGGGMGAGITSGVGIASGEGRFCNGASGGCVEIETGGGGQPTQQSGHGRQHVG